MSQQKAFEIVFDTRRDMNEPFQLLIARVNNMLHHGQLYHEVAISKWEMYHNGLLVKGGAGEPISLLRHFYHDPQRNKFGGGFLPFEIIEDLGRHYNADDIILGMDGNIDLVFTVVVTTP